MDTYPLSESSLSPYCQGIWDPNSQKFFDSDSLSTIQCCSESCKPNIDYCFAQCKDNSTYSKCPDQCAEMAKDCNDSCLEINSPGLKISSDCAEQSGCGTFPVFNTDCMKEEKDNIISCCKKSCITNQSIDCDSGLCDNFYSYLANSIKSSYENYEPIVCKKNYFYIVVVFWIILGIFLVYKMKFSSKK